MKYHAQVRAHLWLGYSTQTRCVRWSESRCLGVGAALPIGRCRCFQTRTQKIQVLIACCADEIKASHCSKWRCHCLLSLKRRRFYYFQVSSSDSKVSSFFHVVIEMFILFCILFIGVFVRRENSPSRMRKKIT